MNYRLKDDELITAATFITNDLVNDRAEIEVLFPEINKKYETDFIAQTATVKKLDSKYAKTKQQTAASQKLYNHSDGIHKQLNVLSLKCKRAGVQTGLITTIKKKLHNLDMEGAHQDLLNLAKFVKDNIEVLGPVGVQNDFPDAITDEAEKLLFLNGVQNSLITQGEKLTEANQKEYKKLRKMISYIMNAGRLTFEDKRRKHYTMSDLVQRMRSFNQGKKDDDNDTPE
ncbi:hypothetical protein ACI6PS_02170 [Flavobacterium sp. PLA-1-15]|uniref:hypothetical protein n=1 Tax=Flavobacterium sp. PLA-1-15 TaxID=3380533 RepID=UPI003B7791CA